MIKNIGSIVIGLALIVGIYLYGVNNRNESVALGGLGNDIYLSTTTDSTYANSSRSIKTVANAFAPGVLGTVVVTTTSATAVEIMDATSTTDVASTSLAKFGASPATGSYIFDTAFSRGLRVNFLGSFTGNYTITYH